MLSSKAETNRTTELKTETNRTTEWMNSKSVNTIVVGGSIKADPGLWVIPYSMAVQWSFDTMR